MDTSSECKETRREIRRRCLKKMNGDTYGGKTEDYEEDGGGKINEQQMRMGCEKSRKKKWMPA